MGQSHRWIVDRHEGDVAVVEIDGTGFCDLPRWLLPTAARPDDVLAVIVEAADESVVITIRRDPAATERARQDARAAVDRLKRKDPGGDLRL